MNQDRQPKAHPSTTPPTAHTARRKVLLQLCALSVFAFFLYACLQKYGSYVPIFPKYSSEWPGAALVSEKLKPISPVSLPVNQGPFHAAVGIIEGPNKMSAGSSYPVTIKIWMTNTAVPHPSAMPLDPNGRYEVVLTWDAIGIAHSDWQAGSRILTRESQCAWKTTIALERGKTGYQCAIVHIALTRIADSNLIQQIPVPSTDVAMRSDSAESIPLQEFVASGSYLDLELTSYGPLGWPSSVLSVSLTVIAYISLRLAHAVARKRHLVRLGFGQRNHANRSSLGTPIKQQTFLVALSFPGELRPFVADVAAQLSASLGKNNVFFDHYYEAELAQPDLDLLIGGIYEHQSKLLVPFFSADYARKKWCNLEWRRMRQILFDMAPERIMPFRFDNAPIAGFLPTDGYIMVGSRTPEQVAELILERLRAQPGFPPAQTPPS